MYMLSKMQLIFVPLSFSLLFFSMLLYWGQAAFFSYTKYKKLSDSVFYLSLLSVTSVLLLRWLESGHFPLSNLYESLLFLSWSLLVSQLIAKSSNRHGEAQKTKALSLAPSQSARALTSFKNNPEEVDEFIDLVGVILSPLALTSYAFAYLYLPKDMQKATALVPALQSNWLMMHVTVMILSYAALLCGSVLSMAFLLINLLAEIGPRSSPSIENNSTRDLNEAQFTKNIQPSLWIQGLRNTRLTAITEALTGSKTNPESITSRNMGQSAIQQSSKVLTLLDSRNQNEVCDSKDSTSAHINPETVLFYSQMRLCDRLDNYSYRMLGLGFPLLTVGILSGAVWANSAWGSYWSWDPKETWALITWLVFAMYLHARITKGWSGKRAAIIATVGFFVVWFCYLGVNLLGTGLHSYGWFS